MAPTTFFDLPRGLRDEIYTHVFEPGPQAIRVTADPWNRWQWLLRLKFPVLFRINRQIRAEAMELWYSTTTFLFNQHRRPVPFLQVIGPENVGNVKTFAMVNMWYWEREARGHFKVIRRALRRKKWDLGVKDGAIEVWHGWCWARGRKPCDEECDHVGGWGGVRE